MTSKWKKPSLKVTPAMESLAQEACSATSAVCEPMPYLGTWEAPK